MITCSTSAGSMPARASALRMASPPRVVALSDASAPPRRPNGVRAVERTTVGMVPLRSGRGNRLPRTRLDLGTHHAVGGLTRFALELDRHVRDAEVVVHRFRDAEAAGGGLAHAAVSEHGM